MRTVFVFVTGLAIGVAVAPMMAQGDRISGVNNMGDERDVQNNITAPDYGKFYNPIQRSIGFVVGTTRP